MTRDGKPRQKGGRLRRFRHMEAKDESLRQSSGGIKYCTKVKEKQSLTQGQCVWQCMDHSLSLRRRLVTKVWITSPWTKMNNKFPDLHLQRCSGNWLCARPVFAEISQICKHSNLCAAAEQKMEMCPVCSVGGFLLPSPLPLRRLERQLL